jgi:YbbR domain-containing protein
VETLITLDVPIQYTNRDPDLEVIESSHDAVRVYLGGSGSLIRSIRAEDVQVRLKLDKTLPGQNSLYITQDNISLPPGVYLKKIEPATIQLTLDKLVTKELPIQVTWKGKFDKNLILTEVILNPEKIKVIGGRKILENVATVYTQEIPLDEIKNSGNTTVGLLVDGQSFNIAPEEKTAVTVRYEVSRREPSSK